MSDWQFKSDWNTSPRNPTYADLQNIAFDQGRAGLGHWGGDVDAGAHGLDNLGFYRLNPIALPASASVGMIVTDSADGVTKQWTGTAWRIFASGYTPVFRSAAGAPSDALGANGDLYINSANGDVYGPKSANVWGAPVANIRGAQGIQGLTGPVGPQGSTGATGSQGPQGTQGPQGLPGLGYTARGAYAAGTTYAQGDMVTYGGQIYYSLQGSNTGHQPDISATWWYRSASQTPWVSDIDAAGFKLLGTGNIGVGTASPIHPLQVRGSVGQGICLENSDNNFASVGTWLRISMGAASGNTNAQIQNFNTGGASAGILSLNPLGGNVGIGTASPTEKLALAGGNLVLDAFSDASTTQYLAQHGIFFRNQFSPNGANNTETERRNVSITTGRGTADLGDCLDINGAHHISFFTGGANERLRIGGSGNVGIGTTAPDAPLAFAGAAGQKVSWYQTGSNYKFGLSIVDQGGGLFTTRFYMPTAYAGSPLFQFGGMSAVDGTTYSPYLTVHGNGNVGIGTTVPNETLSLNTAANRTTVATANQLAIGEPTNNAGYRLNFGFAALSSVWTGVVQALSAGSGAPLVLNPNGGNVGIGTASPAAALDVAGSKYGAPSTSGSAPGDSNFRVLAAGHGEALDFGAGGCNWIQSRNIANYATNFPLALNPNGGNVGIGTASPGYHLHMEGGRAMFSASTEPYAIGLRNSSAATVAWLGADAAGTFMVCEAGGAARMQLTQAGNLTLTGTVTANGVLLGSAGVTTQSVVTGSRLQGTIYQNTTGKPMFVSVGVQLGGGITGNAYSDSSASPSTIVVQVTAAGSPVASVMAFWVMPGNYYKVYSAGAISIYSWTEWY